MRYVATGLEPPREGPGATQTSQDRPREAQDSPTRPPEVVRGAQTRQATISKRVLSDSGAPWDLEKPHKVLYCRRFSWFPLSRKGAVHRRPKRSKRSPQGGPDEPQARPGRPQERPKSPPDGSKRHPERAKRRPRPPRSAPGEGQKEPKPPKRLQGGLQESMLVLSGGARGAPRYAPGEG